MVTGAGALFVMYFSKGLVALDTMDFWVGTVLIYVLATLQVILFAWVLGVEKGTEFAEEGSEIRLPKLFPFVIKYISPTYLIIVFLAWCVHPDNLPARLKTLANERVPLLSIALIAAVSIGLLLLIRVALNRWNVEQLDDRGK